MAGADEKRRLTPRAIKFLDTAVANALRARKLPPPPVQAKKEYMAGVSSKDKWQERTLSFFIVTHDVIIEENPYINRNVIPVSSALAETFREAARYWAARTCIDFQEIDAETFNLIEKHVYYYNPLPEGRNIPHEFTIVSGLTAKREAFSHIGVQAPLKGFVFLGELCDNDLNFTKWRESLAGTSFYGAAGSKREYLFCDDSIPYVDNWCILGSRYEKTSVVNIWGILSWFPRMTVAHEIGHTLSLTHTMTRIDRDEFITINETSGYDNNFKKFPNSEMVNFGNPYDFGSTMHYNQHSEVTMATKPKYRIYGPTMGSYVPSFYDIKLLNDLYCTGVCEQAINCSNGGIPHPRKCGTCICPIGYGGAYCDETGVDCGNLAYRAAKTMNYFFIQVPSRRPPEDYELVADKFANEYRVYCGWWITAPKSTRIRVSVHLVKGNYARLPTCTDGCISGGVEPKLLLDHRYVGARMCCDTKDKMYDFVSEGNVVPILAFSNVYPVRALVRYQITKDRPTLTVHDIPGTSATYNPNVEPVLPLGVVYSAGCVMFQPSINLNSALDALLGLDCRVCSADVNTLINVVGHVFADLCQNAFTFGRL